MKTLFLFACLFSLCITGALLAQTAAPDHVVASPKDVQWGPAPPGLPEGAKIAVLEGDPGAEGQPFAIRVLVPDGYKIGPHFHPTREHVVVLRGDFNMGIGDAFDKTKTTSGKPGAFMYMDANVHHFAWMKGETEFVVYGTGPFAITYVNPADDPRTKK